MGGMVGQGNAGHSQAVWFGVAEVRRDPLAKSQGFALSIYRKGPS